LTVWMDGRRDKHKGREQGWTGRVRKGAGGLKWTAVRLFSGLAGSYDRTLELATLLQDRRWKKWVAEKVTRRGGLLLDLGSGTLVLEERLGGREVKVVGVDVSREMVMAGKRKGLENVALVNGDAEFLPFRAGTFDDAASCYVAKYVSIARFSGELGRVVKPGGTVATYDFVRPRGPFSVLLDMYIHGGLRIVGFLLGMARSRSAFTFRSLPGIVDGATWDQGITEAMDASGFEVAAFERLTGGAVSAYCGVKRK